MYCALDDQGRFVHVAEVARGRSCNCVCAQCDEPVIARQGGQRLWHFAHESGHPPCAISYESFLHRFVKQVVVDSGGLQLPALSAGYHYPPSLSAVIQDDWLPLRAIELEAPLGSLRPDLLGQIDGHPVAIEIAYTSFCDAEKVEEFERQGVTAVEFDVSRFEPENFDAETVRHTILTDQSSKKWLSGLTKAPAPEVAAVPAVPSEKDSVAEVRHVLSVIIAGRPVRLKKLRWGLLVLSYDYGEEVCRRIRHLARRYNGRWDWKHLNWQIQECWQPEVEATLRAAHDPDSLAAAFRR